MVVNYQIYFIIGSIQSYIPQYYYITNNKHTNNIIITYLFLTAYLD